MPLARALRIRYTRHARLRMAERGIAEAEVRAALARGKHEVLGEKGVAAYMYFHVVYRRTDAGYVVITVVAPR